ncbi:hypothetical protein [Vibrio maerlii]|uniref:hypothetical protein n=1 Tax=Vibrio maerlii TaxID=2231648 RepID=UPI000E3B6CC8|nr:hypothetical protein [Vibrio maerlii]
MKPLLNIALLTTALISTASYAKWDNPVDRYKNEYKNHMSATCPVGSDNIQHFVYFAIDRQAIHDHPLLSHERFVGAQIMYPWEKLEPQRGEYDFSIIREDYEYLKSHGKKLFVQLQDATFYSENKGVPSYLFSPEFDGGAVNQYTDDGVAQGWVAKRWNPEVRERFSLLLEALGAEFDGKIEGINLQESAIGISHAKDPSFTEEKYLAGLKSNMLALKHAFPQSTTMQYANFVNGEWLPWEDKGYLKSLYEYGQEIGVGMGAPDLMVKRRGQLNHALAMMHESEYSVPLGIAIQDGNYIGETGNTEVQNKRNNIVPMLHSFAKDFLKVDYMFWVNQQPYFEQDVMPCFSSK